MRGGAPLTSPHGPVILVADWSVPAGQLRITLLPKGWMVILAGGLTVTVVVAGVDVQPPIAEATLNNPELLVDALVMEGFCRVELKPIGPDQV